MSDITDTATGRSSARGPLAIVHANVITMESEKVLEDHTVVVEKGVIRALAPSAAIDTTGMQVVDGSGRYLMPGLADVHTHVTDAGVCRLYLANGVTRLRNMDGRPLHLALAQKIERGERLGPRIFNASPLIDGLSEQGLTARPGSLVLTDPAKACAVVRELVARGYREIKAYQWLELDALTALGAAATRAGVRMAGHCPDGITFEQSIAAGMGCFEHLTGIATGHLCGGRTLSDRRDGRARLGSLETLEAVAHHLDFEALRRLAETMAAKGIWNCPTLVVWQKQIQEPSIALKDSALQYEHPSVVSEWGRPIEARFANLPCAAEKWLSLGRARDEALATVVSILHEEGAPLLLGTDAPNPFVIHGFAVHEELANLVRAGLSPYQALRCGTTEAARFLGDSDSTGSIAVGKRADLLLLRQNPLADIGAVRNGLESVFVSGHYLTRADLDALFAEHLAELAAVPGERLPELPEAAGAKRVRQGFFKERAGEMHIGQATFCHSRLPDGGWRVDEHLVRSGPRGRQRRVSRLRLGPDWTVRRADIEAETDVGRENCGIDWSAGTYRVRITQPDGYTCDSEMASRPLLPGERLAFSVLPAWLASQKAPVTAPSLSIEHEKPNIASIAAESVPADAKAASDTRRENWRVSVTYPGELASQTYQVSNDGTLLYLEDTLFGAPRELIADAAHRGRDAQRTTGT